MRAENPNRLPELDFLRGLAVLFMIAVHSLMLYTARPDAKLWWGKIILFLGGAPAAPVFLFLMGYLVGLKPRAAFSGTVSKAAEILFLGYLLNVLRFSLPIWAGVPLKGDAWLGLFMIDILQLAAPMMLVLWLLKNKPGIVPMVLMLVAAFAAPFAWGLTKTPHPFDFLWGDGYLVYFPLLPWAAFPLFGLCAAKLEARRRLALSFFLLVVGIAVLQLWPPDSEFYSYYRSAPGATLWMMGFCGLWLAAAQWIAPRVPALLFAPLKFFSRNVTSAYFFSWLILSWGVALTGYRQLGLVGTLSVIVVATLLTAGAIVLWQMRPSYPVQRNKSG